MQIIDEILELAKVLEPAAGSNAAIEFNLELKRDGTWSATVAYGHCSRPLYFVKTEGKTSEEALSKLQDQLTALAKQTHSWLGRILAKLGTKLKAVK